MRPEKAKFYNLEVTTGESVEIFLILNKNAATTGITKKNYCRNLDLSLFVKYPG